MGLAQREDISRSQRTLAPVAQEPLAGIGGQITQRTRDISQGAQEAVRIGEAIRLTPEWFDARDRERWAQWVDISGLRRAEDGSGPGISARLTQALERVDLGVASRPWGPYRAIQLQPVLTNDLDPRSVGGGPAPAQAQEWYARRQVAIIRMRDVLNSDSGNLHPLDAPAWLGSGWVPGMGPRDRISHGVLFEEMDREGITREEQNALRQMTSLDEVRSYIDNMSMTSPFLSAQIVDWQQRRDRAIREISAVVGRGTHDVGSANWRGALDYHYDNGGITAAEREVLLAGNVAALASMNPISPAALLWGKAIVEPLNPEALNIDDLTPGGIIGRGDGSCRCPTRQYFTQIVSPMSLSAFINIMLTTETGARVVADDNAIRVREGLAGRGTTYFNAARGMTVTAPDNEFYRFPRDGSEVVLPVGATRPAQFFSYQWSVFRNSPYLNASTISIGDAFILPDREVIIAPPCPERGPEPRREADWKRESVQVFLRGPNNQMFPGPMVDHYCDLSVARWWFEIALALATDNRIIARLDSVSPDNGLFPEQADQNGPWNPIGWYTQVYYVRAIAEAIANGYNALNLPWYIDPVARALYRDWFAGHDADEYNIRSNYNANNWFTNTEQCNEKRYTVLRARIRPNSYENTSVGQMPALLSRMWNVTHPDSNDRRTLEFVQKAGVMLWSESADRDPYVASNSYNRGFASGFAMGWDVFFASPLALPREPTAGERTLYVGSRARPGQGTGIGAAIGSALFPGVGTLVGAFLGAALEGDASNRAWDLSDSKPTLPQPLFSEDWYASIIHAPPLQDRNNICDWRAGGFDPAGVAGVHVQGTVPLRWYVAWLREWAMACTTIEPLSQQPAAEMPTVSPGRRWAGFAQGNMPRRDVGTILRASKTYAMDINMTWGAQFRGQDNFARILGVKAREFGAAQPNATIRMVGGIVGQIGGTAVSIATMVSAPTPPIPGAGGQQGAQEGQQGAQEGQQGAQEGQQGAQGVQSSAALGQAAGALATAGVGLVTELLANAFPNYDCASYGRDDLGRAKPNFERTSLSGDALTNTPPSLTLQLPSGFCRTSEPLPPFVEMPPPPPPPPPPVQTGPEGLSNIAKVGLAVASVGAVAAVAYFVANRPKTI